jgi:hypothetical protein
MHKEDLYEQDNFGTRESVVEGHVFVDFALLCMTFSPCCPTVCHIKKFKTIFQN